MNSQPTSLNDQLSLTFRPVRWYGVSATDSSATINQLSPTGLMITSGRCLKVNQKISLNLTSKFHTLKQLKAEVISVKLLDTQNSQYHCGVKFCFDTLPETAKNNVQRVLQIIEQSLNKMPR